MKRHDSYNFQGSLAGGVEIHQSAQQYWLKDCSNSQTDRGSYSGENCYNGIWTIQRKSGENPELTASCNGIQKFKQLLSSYCRDSEWVNQWKQEVASMYFHVDHDIASVQFRVDQLGSSWIISLFFY